MSPSELKILLLEDLPSDAELVERELRKAGVAFRSRRTATREDFVSALDTFAPDIVLSDFNLPGFDGRQALKIVRAKSTDLPFILVSGVLGDDSAVELIKEGANDYVLKDRMARLGAAVRRALAEAEEIRARKTAEEEIARIARFPLENPHPVLRLDRAGVVLFSNHAAQQLGIAPHTLAEQAPPLWREMLAQAAKVTGARAFEVSETDREFLLHAVAITGTEYVNVYGVDITQRKRAEEQLARQQAVIERGKREWTEVFDAVEEPVMLHDKDFRVIRANKAYAKAAGREFTDIIGRPYWESFPRLEGPLPGCRGFAESTASGSEEFTNAAGEIYVSHAYPARDDHDVHQFSVHIFENVTERRRSQEALRLSEERFRKAFETAGHGMALVGLDGRFLEINARWTQIVGYSRDELLARDFQSITHPDDLDADLAHVRRLLGGETNSYEMEKRYIHKDGRIVWIQLNVGLVRDAADKPLHFVTQVQDITARRKADETIRNTLKRNQDQLRVIGTVAATESLVAGEVEQVAREITELAAKAAGCERVNAWLFNQDETELRCIDLYEATPDRHSSGMALKEHEYRHEFEVLKSVNYVDADDALADPRTAGYVDGYLKPLNITSMLDAVIEISGRHLGVLCFEHVGKSHHWEQDEIAFACQLADKIGLAIANRTRRQAEEKLIASEAALKEAQAIAHVGSWEFDIDNGLLHWSDETYRIFGVTPGKFQPSYESFFTRVHPDDSRAVEAAYKNSLKTGKSYDIEHRIVLDDGGIRVVAERVAIVVDAGGRPIRTLGTVQDITERKRTEDSIRTSRDLLKSVVENAPVRVFWKDREMRYLGCNTSFACDAGKSKPEDLIGKDDFEMGWHDRADLYRADDKRVMDSDAPKLGFEEPLTMPDGRQIWLRTSKVPLHDPSGKVMGMLGVYEDITDRKLAEESRRIAAAIVDASPTVLFRWRATDGWPTTYVSPNVARVFGYEVSELTSPPKPYASLVHPDDLARVAREVEEHVAAGRAAFVQEYRVLAKSGAVRWVEDSTTVERDAGGRVVHFQGTVIDVTDRKRAQEEISAKTDRLQRFQRLTVGRELDMARMKQEINALLRELGRPEKYEARATRTEAAAADGGAQPS